MSESQTESSRGSMEISNEDLPTSPASNVVLMDTTATRSDVNSASAALEPKVHKQEISLFSAAMLLMTWSTSSSNVMYPWTFGVLGVVGGPLLMLIAFSISWACTRWTIQAARATGAKTFGDLGDKLHGFWGRVAFEGSQIAFQQLFLPVAIVLSATSLQSLNEGSEFWSCNGNAALIFVLLAIFLVQMSQQLGHMVGLAYFSVALILVQTAALLYAFSCTSPRGMEDDDASWEFFVGQGAGHGDRYSWYSIFGALGVFIYSCLPNCIVVETLASLSPESQANMEKACDASFIFYVIIYLITGIPAVLLWGGDIPLPVSDAMQNDWAGVVTKVVLVYSTLLDFVLASVTVNQFLVKHFSPDYDFSFSWANSLRWASYSLPSLVLATMMALLIPRLESLTGLLNSVTGTTLQVTAISFCLLTTGSTVALKVPSFSQPPPRPSIRFAVLAATALYGIILTVCIFAEAVYNITQTDYSGNFWCDVVG